MALKRRQLSSRSWSTETQGALNGLAAPHPALRALLLGVTMLLVPKASHPSHQRGQRWVPHAKPAQLSADQQP